MGELTTRAARAVRGISRAGLATLLVATLLALSAAPASAQASSSVILNEWNAVASDSALQNGAIDPAFGVGLGNGGDWFEVVVTGAGGVDLTGWTLEMSDNDSGIQEVTDTFVFNGNLNSALGGPVPAGTIITVSEDVADELDNSDFHINLQANSDDEGTAFTALSQSNFDTNSKNWQLTIRNAANQVVFGPAGEGVSPASGVGNEEVGKLEADPSTSITPNSAYNDGATSTWGAPNVWDGGNSVQDFSTLRGVAAEPTASASTICDNNDGRVDAFLSNPTGAAVTYVISVTGVASRTVSVGAGMAMTEMVGGVPDGAATISITANGSTVLTQAATIECDPQIGTSQLILNEWNAVGNNDLLDNDASDVKLGRVVGNGGDWFELVVADPAGADIRGWSLEISDIRNNAGIRQITDTLVFSNSAQLAAVPGGTIITVSEDIADDFDLSDHHMNLQANSDDLGAGFTVASQSNFDTSGSEWQVEIRDSNGALVFGPSGEGIAPPFGVGSGEVGKLEATPSTSIVPTSNYNDGSTSTWGAPNIWASGRAIQDFSEFWGPNPSLDVHSIQCSGGNGIVRINVTNNYTTTETFEVTLFGQLTNYVGTKEHTVAPGATTFVGFSGRPDSLYNVLLTLDGAPLASLNGFDSVNGQTVGVGPVVHCGTDDVAIVANVCDAGAGIVYLSMRNDTGADLQLRGRVWYETQVIDDQADANFGGIERSRVLAAGEQRIEAISGRTQDIGILMTARQGASGFQWVNGADAGAGAVLVDCQGDPAEAGVLVSCLDFNGRIDVFLRRPTSDATEYRVTISGPGGFNTQRLLDLSEDAAGRVSVTGRADGSHPITVEASVAGGAFAPIADVPSELVVSCDNPPTIPVTVRNTCLSGNGRIDVVLGNTEVFSSTFVVDVTSGSITDRTRVVPGESRSTITYTGRPDSVIPISVTQNGIEIFSSSVTVACDG